MPATLTYARLATHRRNLNSPKTPCSADPPAVKIALSGSEVQMKTRLSACMENLAFVATTGTVGPQGTGITGAAGEYLFVWGARSGPEISGLPAAINCDERANGYGKVITTIQSARAEFRFLT